MSAKYLRTKLHATVARMIEAARLANIAITDVHISSKLEIQIQCPSQHDGPLVRELVEDAVHDGCEYDDGRFACYGDSAVEVSIVTSESYPLGSSIPAIPA